MATQYYALDGAAKGNSVRVVIHLAVPPGTNAAGLPWVSVAADYQTIRTGTTVSEVPVSLLEPGAQADLDAGVLFEHEFRVTDDKNALPAARLQTLEDAVVSEAADQLVILQTLLNYWGRKGSV